MHLKASSIEIPENDPFKNDALGRAKCAEILTNLVLNSTRPTVLAMNSSWGTGKTTFLAMWCASLKVKGIPVISFNAWANDYTSDALTALIAEIDGFTKGLTMPKEARDPALEIMLRARKSAGKILVASIPTALRVLTSGVLNLDEKTIDAISEGVEKVADKRIEEYLKAKDAVQDLKKSLADLVETLPSPPESAGGVKLVVVVDELDRCRPTFAIDVLEKIKHFFGVPGIMFVVAVDREQLSHSIKTVYGQGMDTDGYLRRFFDFEFKFPKVDFDGFCRAAISRLGIEENLKVRNGDSQMFVEIFLQALKPLATAFNLSLRRQEQCFGLLSLTLLTTPPNEQIHPHMLALMIFMKVEKPEFYSGFNSGAISVAQIMDWIRQNPSLSTQEHEDWRFTSEAYLSAGTPHLKDFNVFVNTLTSFNSKGPNVHPDKDRLERIQAAFRRMPSKIEHTWKPLFEKLEFQSSILSSTQISKYR